MSESLLSPQTQDEQHVPATRSLPDHEAEKQVYILENLDSANCAAKMEKKIKELPGVSYASITHTTRQLHLVADNQEALLPRIQDICTDIESAVRVVPKDDPRKASTTKTYLLKNLNNAGNASRIERQINAIGDVMSATVSFATKQLKVTGTNPDRLLPQYREICSAIDDKIEVVPKDTAPRSADTLAIEAGKTSTKAVTDDVRSLVSIIGGALLLLVAGIVSLQGQGLIVTLPIYIIAYILLGGRVVLTAARNLAKGIVFDEYFLMSVATLGAFAIGKYPEAVVVMLFYCVGEFFEAKAVERSRRQIMDTADMRPEVVNLLVEGGLQVIAAADAQVGEIILVQPGDRIPLDGVVVEGESNIDTAPITGEPIPVNVKSGDEVISGCVNTTGQLKVRVEKTLEESMVSRILDSVESAAASKPAIDRFITRFTKIYTPCVVALAILTAILPSLFTGNWGHWVYTALTFLVISCPCALVLCVPLTFYSGIGAGSKLGILFKGGLAMERMSGVKAVIMDKTGTVTEGNFVVQDIIPAGEMTAKKLLGIAAECELISTHPIATSIVNAAHNMKLELKRPENAEEIAGYGIRVDSPDGLLLVGNAKLMNRYRVDLSDYEHSTYGTEVLVACGGTFLGHIVISDTIKSDARFSVSSLKEMGITTAMLTGDSLESAEAVAAETGIDEVRARLMPQDKLTELINIRRSYDSVMYVGDGINDAPVLAAADVGAAMGNGADAAIEVADAVFMNSNMESIPVALKIAKMTSRIAWQNIILALGVKVLILLLGLGGIASMWIAVFADTAVAVLCVLNSVRILQKK